MRVYDGQGGSWGLLPETSMGIGFDGSERHSPKVFAKLRVSSAFDGYGYEIFPSPFIHANA